MKAPLATTDLPVVNLVVGVFDLDDRSIHEDADRDGDSGERHDVDRQAHEMHGNESEQHRDRNGQNGNDRGRHVPEEEEDHQ